MTTSLAALLGEVEVLQTVGDVAATVVSSVTQDSADVQPGALYCCVKGHTVDGHDLAGQVLAAGAGSLLVERILPVAAPQVRVKNVRASVAPLAAAFWGHPSRHLAVVGVTGTNGKTTTVALLGAICDAAERPCGVVGTLSGARTTPEAPVLQASLAGFLAAGRQVVAMEVSSIALDQHRADAVSFEAAVFTNLSQDHLDYHGTMDAYFTAKARLFLPDRVAAAVVNNDDAWGRKLLQRLQMPVRAFSMSDAEDLDVGLILSRFRWRGHAVALHLGGTHNVANAVAAATAAEALGIEPQVVAAGLTAVSGVPGRLEIVNMGQPFTVLVDYAHTPDGLERVLSGARRAVHSGRIIVVFGCGGDRDRAKRPQMAAVATSLADLAVLTSDNPRSEDPDAIIAEVAAGAVPGQVFVIEPDRAAAITLALSRARPGDVVLITGKGHETGQTTGATTVPFDDRQVARHGLQSLGHAGQRP